MYAPRLELTPEWQEVTFLQAVDDVGEYGHFYRVSVEHEGTTKTFSLSKGAYDVGRPHAWSELKRGQVIRVRKDEDKYAEKEWDYTEEDYRKMPVHHAK